MSSTLRLFADLLSPRSEHCSGVPKHAAELFQRSKGFRGRNGNTTMRLDGACFLLRLSALSLSCVQTVDLYFAGAVFASSNAALMLAQLGDEEAAVKEMQRIARCASSLQ